MKYESGAKVQDLKVVVRRGYNRIIEGVVVNEPPIIIEFVNGEFDSEKWQATDPENRNDNLREMVEHRIESDPHFGSVTDPRGVWHMTALSKKAAQVPPEVAGEPAKKCSHIDIKDGVGSPCPNDAVPGSETCDDHAMDAVPA